MSKEILVGLATLFMFQVSLPALGQHLRCQVVGVIDGDTIDVLHDRQTERIRLNGIDCPEKKQAFGQQAKAVTAALCFDRQVTVEEHGKDRYGRTIATVYLSDGRCLNSELVKDGYAWWYRRYSHDRTLEHLETEAREHHIGLWREANPMPPWEFRHGGAQVSHNL